MSADQQTAPASGTDTDHVDVLIVGAGLSGIGAAARLERERPGTSYAVLERRSAMGGTWDLFRYPGVRSDTDMYTFSYPFRPWSGETSMGQGEDIRAYIRATAAEHDVERHVRYDTRVVSAQWSSQARRWTVQAETDGVPVTRTCSFLYLCAGYYDYDRGHQPDFAGLGDYAGEFVHPQFWPEGLDYDGKRVVVIGSGATAVTLIPAMTDRAAHVTMLQRSPSYVAPMPESDPVADVLRARLPAGVAHRVLRAKNALLFHGIYALSRAAPSVARGLFRRIAIRHLGDADYVDVHFKPDYEPWDQRLTLAPDGDFYSAIARGDASVVTGHIDRFVREGIRLQTGETVPADVVVCATGLRMQALGGIELAVDGRPVDPADSVALRASMLSGVPNLAFCFGYTNNSWTLRADLTSRFVLAVLAHMQDHGYATAVPRRPTSGDTRPFIDDLNSSYIQRGVSQFPSQGDRSPWKIRQNFFVDAAEARLADLTRGIDFGHRVRPAHTAETAQETRSKIAASP